MNEGFDDFNDDVLNIDEFQQKIRLKPDFYIHLTFQALTRVFDGDVSDKEAFNKYIHLVGHLETLCQSNNILVENYDEKIKKLKEEAKKKYTAVLEYDAHMAREKVSLLMKGVFSNGETSGPISLFTNADGSTSRQKETYERIQAKKEILKEKEEIEDETSKEE